MTSVDDIVWSANRNLERVRNLVTLYTDKLGGTGSGRKPVHSTDVLRSAVVFLHGTLEDFLRDLARLRLPNASEDTLNEIPLAGTKGRAEKFPLGRLARHRDESVYDVIERSVSEYLDRFTVNNVPELQALLRKLDISPEILDQYYPYLGTLMERRHHIVHQADRNDTPGQGNHSARSIGAGHLEEWIWAVNGVIQGVSNALRTNAS